MMPVSHSLLKSVRFLTALVALIGLSLTSFAQSNQESQYDRGTPPQHAAGVSAIGSYVSADLGTINLGNGSLNFALPLGSVGGRGFSIPLSLNYSSKVWSAKRGQKFNPEPAPGHMEPVVWGQYGDDTTDIYYFVAGGWTLGAVPFLKVRGQGMTPIENPQTGCTNFQTVLVRLTLVLPDKGEIELRDDAKDGAPSTAQAFGPFGCKVQDIGRGRRWHATDGSGIIFINDNNDGVVNGDLAGVVILSDGTRYHFINAGGGNPGGSAYLNTLARCDRVEDSNGNRVDISYPDGLHVVYTDQLGRVTTVQWADPINGGLTDPETGTPLAVLVTMPAPDGEVRYYKVKTGVMHDNYRADINPTLPVFNGDSEMTAVGTALFGGGVDAGLDWIDGKHALTQLILADGRALNFKYNQYGEVAEVEMPTGGKIQYDYGAVTLNTTTGAGLPVGNTLNAEAIAPGGGNVRAVDRSVVTRRTYPDGVTLEGTWTYTYKAAVSNNLTTGDTQVKCVAGGQTLLDERHYYMPAQRFLTSASGGGVDGTGYSLWSTGLESRSEMRDANGTTILGASEQDWAQRAPIAWTGTVLSQQIANDNRVIESRKFLDDGSQAKVVTAYDQFNNPTRVDEYDFDGSLKRYTTTSYLTGSPYNTGTVSSRNMVRLPSLQSVYDGQTSAELARTNYEYDIYTSDGSNLPLATYSDFASIPGHTTTYDQNFAFRGNPTKVTRMVNGSTFVSSYSRYDVLGNVVSTKDARDNVASISYLDDFGNGSNPGFNSSGHSTYALPTKLTSPAPKVGEAQHVAYSQYEYSTGMPTGFKDRNGVITQTVYDDPFDRPTLIRTGLGTSAETHTAMYYAPHTNPFGIALTNNDVLTVKDQASIDDAGLRTWSHTDGFGRAVENWSRDPQGDVKTATVYDALGRIKQTSNPFRPSLSETAIYITTVYDLGGRVKTTTLPDGSIVKTDYNGARTLVTDQAGKQRLSKTDALGRLTDVWEITAADSATEAVSFPSHAEVTAGYRTKYSYDAIDDLIQVKQQIGTAGTLQTRTFVYDGLKRLTQATNPESGVITYQYDANSNLTQKTDSRVPAVTTTYSYDALNRVTRRAYSDSTPQVDYYYDAQSLPAGAPSFTRGASTGRLVAALYGGATSSTGSYQGYDSLGQIVSSFQKTDSQSYPFGYVYNLAGEMTSQTYPSGRVISTAYDSAGRVSSLTGQKTGEAGKTYASQFSYASHGPASAVLLGNGKWEHTSFNTRLQPSLIGLGTSATDSSLVKLEFTYGSSTTNNGNVQSQTITAPGLTLTQCYSYDSLNRLKTADEHTGTTCAGTQQWKQAFTYDRFGNRNFDLANTTTNVLGSNPSVDQSNNRLTGSGYSYDGVGNLKAEPSRSYDYDADNRLINFNGGAAQYYYDGEGRRVKKVSGGVTTVYVYNVGGQMIAEYTADPVPPAAGGGGTSYLTTDHLGSNRIVTKSDGTVKARYDYLPFGEDLSNSLGGRSGVTGYGAADSTRQKFTSKERDGESGLDYFLARYYSSSQGRFTTPDEFMGGPDELFDFTDDASDNPTFYADLTEPQTLNKYHYCLNNPLIYVDPDGHQGVRQWIKDTLRGAAAAFNEDNGMPAPSGNQTTTGRAIGHGFAILQGVTEVVVGGGMATGGTVGGIVTAPTVVGPVAGAAVTTGGVVVATHGSAVLINTASNIFLKSGPSQQSSSQQQSEPQAEQPRPGSVEATGQQGGLGGSGKPRRHFTQRSGRKSAREASRNGEFHSFHRRRTSRGQREHFHDKQNHNIHNMFGKAKKKLRPGESAQ